ncbi:hypothetical protein [Amycolatopsis anabasis]|uniref:hypothetical protein n=1 Tax=Amycolatopsis anabasis TaxID=1840409 RepID=UPI00131D2E44|nr:hypothetical protein [Amycolatopsis anabasis]
MAELLRRTQCEPTTQYGLFVIDGAADHWTTPDPGSGDWLTATEEQIVIRSASGVWSAPEALLEYWDSEPPTPVPPWDTTLDALTYLSTPTLTVRNLAGDHAFARFTLGQPGVYRVRAHTGHRERLRDTLDQATRESASANESGPVRGAERFLIQFWPGETPDTRDKVATHEQPHLPADQAKFMDAIHQLATRDPATFSDAVENTRRATQPPPSR